MATLRKSSRSSAVAVPWATAQDEELSFTAIGVLTRCLSLPPGWEFSAKRLARSCKKQGEAAVLAALKELEVHGYRRVIVERIEGGRFTTWVEFSEVPVPEWIEANAAAAARRANGKRPGPPKGIDQASPVKPQVTPEPGEPRLGERVPAQRAETAGRTGTRETGTRSAELLREDLNTEELHTPAAASAPPADGVCDESTDFKAEGARAEIGWEVTPEQVGVGDHILTVTVHPDVVHLIEDEDRDRLAAKAGALLARGWSRQLVERTVARRTNAQTVAPTVVIERALDEAIKQALTPSPHRLGLEQQAAERAKRPTVAKLNKALGIADRLYPDEAEFAKITAWIRRASAADVDKWIAEREAEAAAAPLHIPMTNAPAAS